MESNDAQLIWHMIVSYSIESYRKKLENLYFSSKTLIDLILNRLLSVAK